jgi:hypothetical protein
MLVPPQRRDGDQVTGLHRRRKMRASVYRCTAQASAIRQIRSTTAAHQNEIHPRGHDGEPGRKDRGLFVVKRFGGAVLKFDCSLLAAVGLPVPVAVAGESGDSGRRSEASDESERYEVVLIRV